MPAALKHYFFLVSFALLSCGPHLSTPFDAAGDVNHDVQLAPPVLQTLPALAPYWVATIRGTAQGADRVLVYIHGPGATSNSSPATVNLDGTFCIGVTLPGPGAFTFYGVSTNIAGQVSLHSNTVMSTFSPSAPPVVGAPTCADSDPADCNSMGICCSPACAGRTCGSDHCGGTCGPACPAGQMCSSATGQCCAPNCTGRACGDDGCGGTCGTPCTGGQVCTSGHCVNPPCTSFTDCVSCSSLAPSGNCGWCPAQSHCRQGSTNMSDDGTCTTAASNWIWLSSGCP